MTDTGQILSMNEVKFFFTRAAVGVGVPFGLAEDFSQAAIWLAGCGFDPGKTAAPALSALERDHTTAHIIQHEDGVITRFSGAHNKPISALFAGPCVTDWLGVAAVSKKTKSIELSFVDQPELVAACVASTPPRGATRFVWQKSNEKPTTVTIDAEGVGLFEDYDIDGAPSPASPMTVEFAPAKSAAPKSKEKTVRETARKPVEDGIEVAQEYWAAIYNHFCRCLVPSSAQSRMKGAGAGLTDND